MPIIEQSIKNAVFAIFLIFYCFEVGKRIRMSKKNSVLINGQPLNALYLRVLTVQLYVYFAASKTSWKTMFYLDALVTFK